MLKTIETNMAKKKDKRDDLSVKIDKNIVRKAKHVATHRDITLAEYLSELLDKPVQRDYTNTVKEMGGSLGCDK